MTAIRPGGAVARSRPSRASSPSRPYRDALTPHAALLEIERCAGSHFDSELASAFVAVCAEARAA